MAAGFSRRMGEDKLLLPFRGLSLLERAVRLLETLPLHQRIVVSTPERLVRVALPADVAAVVNYRPDLGQSESLRLGIAAADGDAYLFLTADQPLLDAHTVAWLLSHGDGERIVYPVVEGRPASPALFPARFRAELLAQRGDAGGRAVRAAHPEFCRPVPVADPLPFRDIDTREEYEALRRLEAADSGKF